MKPLKISKVKKLLEKDPNTIFYLFPIKIRIIDSNDMYIIAGYHIYTTDYQLQDSIKVVGNTIYAYINF
jgi:hypothetical protein